MTSTRIELSFNKITRLADLSDLAEMLFPGNRNQQYAFLVIWFSLKWSEHRIVPNFTDVCSKHGVSKRTQERVRAKIRRMGLIDHVSRFNAKHGYREGWVFSTRFERGLKQITQKIAALKDNSLSAREKDDLVLQLAEARRDATTGERHEVHGDQTISSKEAMYDEEEQFV